MRIFRNARPARRIACALAMLFAMATGIAPVAMAVDGPAAAATHATGGVTGDAAGCCDPRPAQCPAPCAALCLTVPAVMTAQAPAFVAQGGWPGAPADRRLGRTLDVDDPPPRG